MSKRKNKEFEAIFQNQNGNIYKVLHESTLKRTTLPSTKKRKSFFASKEIIKKDNSALGAGGEIFTPMDASMDGKLDPS